MTEKKTSGPRTVDRVQVYTGVDDKLYWRFKAGGNNKTLADSGQGYVKVEDMYSAIRKVTGCLPTEDPNYGQSRWPQIYLVFGDSAARERWYAWAWRDA